MYDPAKLTGEGTAETADSKKSEDGTDSADHAEASQDMWRAAPFAAQLRV